MSTNVLLYKYRDYTIKSGSSQDYFEITFKM